MKTFKLFLLSFLFTGACNLALAQVKTEKINVSGECGSCKKKIEGAAKKAGASYASWDVDSKVLTIKYNSSSSNTAKIEKAIAGVGYNTPNYKATEASYKKLDKCCQYQREATSCCDSAKCADAKCMKDGKCDKDMQCCKDSGCDQKDCCKKS